LLTVPRAHCTAVTPPAEFLAKLEKAARKMPRPYKFDLLHSDGIRHADLDAGVRVLNELI
jgi:hypothetical protein